MEAIAFLAHFNSLKIYLNILYSYTETFRCQRSCKIFSY